MTLRTVCWATLFIAVPVSASPPSDPPRVAGLLRTELGNLAQDVKQFLATRSADTISVGEFTGPPQLPSGAGPGLVMVIVEELERTGLRVKRSAKYGLSGTFRATEVDGPDGKKLRALVKAKIEDSSGTVLGEIEQRSDDPDALAKLFGLSFQRGRQADGRLVKDDTDNIARRFHDPATTLRGSQILASADSPYAVEILVKGRDGQYRPRAAKNDDGLAFVGIERGESYAVRLTNNSPYETAVALSIDGLSMFAFSTDRRSSKIILSPNSSELVRGWHRTPQRSEEFLITSYAEGAVAELNASPAKVGTITATFVASWERTPPRDEPGTMVIASPAPPPTSAVPRVEGMMPGSAAPSSPNSRPTVGSPPPTSARPGSPAPSGGSAPGAAPDPTSDATGRGEGFDKTTTRVARQFGVVRAAITVRYTR